MGSGEVTEAIVKFVTEAVRVTVCDGSYGSYSYVAEAEVLA